jgi:hypothetical protein
MDVTERPEVAAHVQRKTVGGDPPIDMEPQGGDLPLFDPDAGVILVPFPLQMIMGEDAEDRLLQFPDEFRDRFLEKKDRIADQLAGAVIGYPPSPVGLADSDPVPADGLLADKKVGGGVPLSERKDRGVLQEQEMILSLPLLPPLRQTLLPAKRPFIGKTAGINAGN